MKRKHAETWTQWTVQEENLLRKLVAEGKTASEIAKVLTNRTIYAIQNRRGILCLHRFLWVGRKHKKPRQYWSETEVALLRKYLEKGDSFQQICSKFPTRSPNSVRSKAIRITRYWLTPAELAERERLRRKQLRVDWDQEPNPNPIRSIHTCHKQ